MRIRTDTKGRDQTLRMLMQATGEATKTGALFAAAEHYLEDLGNKRRVIDDLDPELAEALSTTELPLRVEVETHVGPEGDE